MKMKEIREIGRVAIGDTILTNQKADEDKNKALLMRGR